MAALNTDMFTKVGDPGTATTLSSPGHTIGGTNITVGSTSNWPTTTGSIFAIDTVSVVNGVETRNTGSYTEWEGVVTSGTDIASMVLRYGTDQNYPAGSTTRVYIPVASSRENRFVDGLLVSHNQDGTLKAGATTASSINVGAIPTNRLTADNGITGSMLGSSAISLGYSPITTNFNAGTTSEILISGLTTTVTVPTGTRNLEIHVYSASVGAASGISVLKLYDGTFGVGSPTQIGQYNIDAVNQGAHMMSVMAAVAAGSKTFSATVINSSANPTISASSTSPAYMLVKAI